MREYEIERERERERGREREKERERERERERGVLHLIHFLELEGVWHMKISYKDTIV